MAASAGDIQAAFNGEPDAVQRGRESGARDRQQSREDRSGQTAHDMGLLHGTTERAAMREGAEKECNWSFVLNMKVRGVEELKVRGRGRGDLSIYAHGRPRWMKPLPVAKLELTLTTLAGNVAATLTWPDERPVEEFPSALRAAVRSSGFEAPMHHEWKIVLPNGALLDPRKGWRLSEQVLRS